jgi:hypothetical protein
MNRADVTCIAAASLTLFVNVPATSSSAETSTLAGRWFTEGTDRSASERILGRFIHDRQSDGIFFVHIRELDHCREVRRWIESGTWSFVNGSIHQTNNFVDNEPAQFEDEYRLLSQSRDLISTLDLETGIEWKSVRVTPNFKFPPPKNCPVA